MDELLPESYLNLLANTETLAAWQPSGNFLEDLLPWPVAPLKLRAKGFSCPKSAVIGLADGGQFGTPVDPNSASCHRSQQQQTAAGSTAGQKHQQQQGCQDVAATHQQQHTPLHVGPPFQQMYTTVDDIDSHQQAHATSVDVRKRPSNCLAQSAAEVKQEWYCVKRRSFASHAATASPHAEKQSLPHPLHQLDTNHCAAAADLIDAEPFEPPDSQEASDHHQQQQCTLGDNRAQHAGPPADAAASSAALAAHPVILRDYVPATVLPEDCVTQPSNAGHLPIVPSFQTFAHTPVRVELEAEAGLAEAVAPCQQLHPASKSAPQQQPPVTGTVLPSLSPLVPFKDYIPATVLPEDLAELDQETDTLQYASPGAAAYVCEGCGNKYSDGGCLNGNSSSSAISSSLSDDCPTNKSEDTLSSASKQVSDSEQQHEQQEELEQLQQGDKQLGCHNMMTEETQPQPHAPHPFEQLQLEQQQQQQWDLQQTQQRQLDDHLITDETQPQPGATHLSRQLQRAHQSQHQQHAGHLLEVSWQQRGQHLQLEQQTETAAQPQPHAVLTEQLPSKQQHQHAEQQQAQPAPDWQDVATEPQPGAWEWQQQQDQQLEEHDLVAWCDVEATEPQPHAVLTWQQRQHALTDVSNIVNQHQQGQRQQHVALASIAMGLTPKHLQDSSPQVPTAAAAVQNNVTLVEQQPAVGMNTCISGIKRKQLTSSDAVLLVKAQCTSVQQDTAAVPAEIAAPGSPASERQLVLTDRSQEAAVVPGASVTHGLQLPVSNQHAGQAVRSRPVQYSHAEAAVLPASRRPRTAHHDTELPANAFCSMLEAPNSSAGASTLLQQQQRVRDSAAAVSKQRGCPGPATEQAHRQISPAAAVVVDNARAAGQQRMLPAGRAPSTAGSGCKADVSSSVWHVKQTGSTRQRKWGVSHKPGSVQSCWNKAGLMSSKPQQNGRTARATGGRWHS